MKKPPPRNCRSARQNSSPAPVVSGEASALAPLVMRPDVASKMAAAKDILLEPSAKGAAAKTTRSTAVPVANSGNSRALREAPSRSERATSRKPTPRKAAAAAQAQRSTASRPSPRAATPAVTTNEKARTSSRLAAAVTGGRRSINHSGARRSAAASTKCQLVGHLSCRSPPNRSSTRSRRSASL